MRLTKIEVCDFRGFPGPAIYDFEFGDARNLLIYGENGSGKSSLFRAVQEFFNRSKAPKPFADLKNIAQPALTLGHVTMHFDNGAIQEWPYGGNRPLGAPPASQTALQVGCLDYRSLLETNFSQKGNVVNLFEIAVNHLLDRMEVPIDGSAARIGDLWRGVLDSKPPGHYRRYLRQCTRALARFNEAFEPLLSPLMNQAGKMLGKFPGCDFELGVAFQPVEYDLKIRKFAKMDLILSVKQNGVTVTNHHEFFNEARLSAIGLVIYLAGLTISVPPASSYPKLLVLDDVLIGLDMQNRMPVLDLLTEYFAGWQVILMTHDKVWYEMVQLQLEGKKDWKGYELYVGEDHFPCHRQRDGGADYFLVRARRHLGANDPAAGAMYARSAFEWKLKTYCDKGSVPVPYKKDSRAISAELFWQAAKTHALNRAGDAGLRNTLSILFATIELCRKIVLNPLSHSPAAQVTGSEVASAIDAVSQLRFK